LLFAVLCVITFFRVKANFWVKAKVPETKGKSLKQFQAVWAEHDPGAPGGTEGTPTTTGSLLDQGGGHAAGQGRLVSVGAGDDQAEALSGCSGSAGGVCGPVR
jgi:hypothetical protein